MERFRASVEAVRRGEEPPEDGYQGAYIQDLAALKGDPVPLMLKEIEATLERFRVHLDSFRRQSELEQRLPELLPRVDTYEKDGALWARSSAYGDDEDRVLLRSGDRSPTYRAADIAYLVDKLERGFDRAIYVLGADHHGTRNWYAAVARMLGYDPERIEVLLYQLVHLTRGGEQTKMSKRRGDVVFLDDFMDEIGVDAARWYLVNRGPDQTIEIDVDLAAERSQKNPVYYVQYAHARIAGILRNAGDATLSAEPAVPLAAEERELVKRLAELPAVVAGRAREAWPTGHPGLRDPGRRRLPPLLPRAPRARERAAGVPARSLPRDAEPSSPAVSTSSGSTRLRECEPMSARQAPDRNIALELVRVTEAAAMAAARWIGRGDKEEADQAAVDAMRFVLDSVSIRGVVVIGEGEKDKAPMLYNGEEVGNGQGPEVDVAVDPLEGTRLTALGQPNAIAVIAVAERGTMLFPGAALYMEKIAVGPVALDAIDIERSPTENVAAVAEALGKTAREVDVVVLERDRHEALIAELREAGARVRLIRDGDVAPAIAAAQPGTGVDMLYGIGGTPEGVISAAALKCVGGGIQARLWPRNDDERQQLVDAGLDPARVLRTDDLVSGEDVFVAATGVTTGSLLQGVQYTPGGAVTDSIVMRSRSGTVRRVVAQQSLAKLSALTGFEYT